MAFRKTPAVAEREVAAVAQCGDDVLALLLEQLEEGQLVGLDQVRLGLGEQSLEVGRVPGTHVGELLRPLRCVTPIG